MAGSLFSCLSQGKGVGCSAGFGIIITHYETAIANVSKVTALTSLRDPVFLNLMTLMDAYAPTMMSAGTRLPKVVDALKQYSGVYFGTIGAGALLAKHIRSVSSSPMRTWARKLYVEEMPLFVIIDSKGNNLYESGRQEYLIARG